MGFKFGTPLHTGQRLEGYLKYPPASNEVDVFFCFDLVLKTRNLLISPYSEYQEFLHKTITKLLKLPRPYQFSEFCGK
jgi:hypothetical protein|tara:strand:- start:187 stop:420 length:234 start_codon:yes stop_codon:yes gene_type:complete